jgi:uncharacterized protein YozE (UPF0346 family)
LKYRGLINNFGGIMKKIRINFEGFSANFDNKLNFLYKLLLKHFDVEISDEPDYLFCSGYEGYNFLQFKGIRIFYMGEVFSPDFNLVDYAISIIDNFDYGDRGIYIPCFMIINGIELLANRKPFTSDDILTRNKFCNFIYSHEGIPKRTELFKIISSYKQVDSAGKYLNNMAGFSAGPRSACKAGFTNKPKWDFQRNYKFSIACENYIFPDYITEKIADAYIAGTIPIYYGDKSIHKYFNPKSFINYSNYASDHEFLEHIKEIDNNDPLFLEMLNEPVFNDSNIVNSIITNLESFLLNIFNQNYDDAFRRPRCPFINLPYEKNMLFFDKVLKRRNALRTTFFKILRAIFGERVYTALKTKIKSIFRH